MTSVNDGDPFRGRIIRPIERPDGKVLQLGPWSKQVFLEAARGRAGRLPSEGRE
jgi:hypothetical protein